MIDRLSNHKVTTKKGLIVDFALDDIRKVNKRTEKMDVINEKRKEDNKEKVKLRKKSIKEQKKKQNSICKKGTSIDDINDINALTKLYSTSISRGKKQRIKKKLVKLGYNPQYLPSSFKEKIPKEPSKQETKSNYMVKKLDLPNQNLNQANLDKKELRKRNKKRSSNKYKKKEKDFDEDFDV